MLKKLGLLALSSLALLSPVLSFASADTVDGFTSDSEICTVSFNNSASASPYCEDESFSSDNVESSDTLYYCVSSDVIPINISLDYDPWITVSVNNYCSSTTVGDLLRKDYISLDNGEENVSINGALYMSLSPITYGSSAGGDSSDGSISVPSGFTDSVNGLVSNFAGSIGNYAPTLILVGLGVVLLFTFWGIIRSWAVRIFNRKGR